MHLLKCPTLVPLAASSTRYSTAILSPLMGSKRSALNYSFRMSNNACWLVFRVGGGGDPLNYSGPMILFPSLQKKSLCGSDVCLSVTWVHEASVVAWLTLAVAAATAWAEQKGDLNLFTSRRRPPRGKNEYDCGELAAPWPTFSRDQFTVHHVPRLTGLLPESKEHNKTPLQWTALLF